MMVGRLLGFSKPGPKYYWEFLLTQLKTNYFFENIDKKKYINNKLLKKIDYSYSFERNVQNIAPPSLYKRLSIMEFD